MFDEITRLPRCYPTFREREGLAARAAEIAALTGADTLVELGSGTSDKTRLLLDGHPAALVHFDVVEKVPAAAGTAVAQDSRACRCTP